MTARAELIPGGPLRAELTVPGSKSLTNRALVCAALAEGESLIRRASFSDDSRLLIGALCQLGIPCAANEERSEVAVHGGRRPAGVAGFQLGNAGTTLRFLTSMLCLGRGTFVVDGNERMRERPIGGLVDALRSLGARIRYLGAEGRPPIEIEADGVAGGRARVEGDASSQFVSSILMAAPYAQAPVELEIAGEIASRPYVDMTLQVMAAFGVPASFRVPTGRYRAREYAVEADAAAAGYFFGMAAVTRGRARVTGIGIACAQPEIRLLQDLERMGCRVERGDDWVEVSGPERPRGIDADMNDHPDSVPTLAAVALFADGPTRVRHVRHLRFKETDRLAALARELGKAGARVTEHADGLDIEPPAQVQPAEIETYGDHRMAMSFAVVGAAAPGIVVLDPGCVSKSYPDFWEAVSRAGLVVRRSS